MGTALCKHVPIKTCECNRGMTFLRRKRNSNDILAVFGKIFIRLTVTRNVIQTKVVDILNAKNGKPKLRFAIK